MAETCIVWIRRDLRVDDNPALSAAARRGGVLPVYIHAPEEEDPWAAGAASGAWLHHSLSAHAARLKLLGVELSLHRGDTLAVLRRLIRETGARALYYNRRYEPQGAARDKEIETALNDESVEVKSYKSALLFEPHDIENKSGKPFRVFTPFYRHCLARLTREPPAPAPFRLEPASRPPDCRVDIHDLGLLPAHPWAGRVLSHWEPGERGALRELEAFLDSAVKDYSRGRDLPGVPGVSRLSPHLHHGEISPRAVVCAARDAEERGGAPARRGAEAFLRQLVWREFAAHLLFHFPSLTTRPFDQRFGKFPWRRDERDFSAWTRGMTGYPMVDAGMRELWTTGWMHNRARMVVASFLTKHLLIDWRRGTRWFWDTLVDADLANNSLGWQWTAGCGVDPAPYFRIFNPVAQGQRFDADGRYVRRFVPELAKLPDRFIHRPFDAGGRVLEEAGVRLGVDYPEPLVEHKAARERALAAYDRIRPG